MAPSLPGNSVKNEDVLETLNELSQRLKDLSVRLDVVDQNQAKISSDLIRLIDGQDSVLRHQEKAVKELEQNFVSLLYDYVKASDKALAKRAKKCGKRRGRGTERYLNNDRSFKTRPSPYEPQDTNNMMFGPPVNYALPATAGTPVFNIPPHYPMFQPQYSPPQMQYFMPQTRGNNCTTKNNCVPRLANRSVEVHNKDTVAQQQDNEKQPSTPKQP